MVKNIHHKFMFPHSPAVVWEYLTKPELIGQWLMETDFKPVIGYEFRFTTRPMPNYNFDGIVYCKVLEIEPLKKLSYSWKGGPSQGTITIDSVVTWTLQQTKSGTELQLLHSGFRAIEDLSMYTIMNDGWYKNIQKIASLINPSVHGNTNA